jgi:rod shape-determining protein MreC
VYDKTVRRRRAVLALLVACALILLTAYFGEARNGALHSLQRGFLTVVAPVQDGANKALKPVRDLFSSIDEAFHAKSQNAELRKQNDTLRRELVAQQINRQSYQQLLSMFHLDNALSVSDYRPVSATVVSQSPNLWYSTVLIDKGSAAGIGLEDPVINGEGLVGKVTEVVADGAQVTLITDSTMGVSARLGTSSNTGIVKPKVGDPNDLLLEYLPGNTPVNKGEYVYTSGTVAPPEDSLYPRGIPIGEVTSGTEESGYEDLNVHPFANLRNLDVVQVLTASAGSRAARLASVVSNLPAGGSSSGSAGGQGNPAGQLASTGAGG